MRRRPALSARNPVNSAERAIDATGKEVFPGVIDAHLHCKIQSHHVDDLANTMIAAGERDEVAPVPWRVRP
jgi:imidazolonepropionase-like amidohydrolase